MDGGRPFHFWPSIDMQHGQRSFSLVCPLTQGRGIVCPYQSTAVCTAPSSRDRVCLFVMGREDAEMAGIAE